MDPVELAEPLAVQRASTFLHARLILPISGARDNLMGSQFARLAQHE
jgi:hypothetical protein